MAMIRRALKSSLSVIMKGIFTLGFFSVLFFILLSLYIMSAEIYF